MVYRGIQRKQRHSHLIPGQNLSLLDARAKHPNPSFQQLHSKVEMGGRSLSQRGHQREDYGIDPDFFRFGHSAKRPKNKGFGVVATFLNPLAPGSESVYSEMYSRKWQTW
jgi:hypothetical protein